MTRKFLLVPFLAIVGGFMLVETVTVFAIPQAKAYPNGATILMKRQTSTKFVDSPEAMCLRMSGSINPTCGELAIEAAMPDQSDTLAQIPFIRPLHLLSLGQRPF